VRDTRRTRLGLAILLALSLGLLAVDSLGGDAPLRSLGGAVFGAAERAAGSVTSPIVSFFGQRATAAASAGRVRALERELTKLRAQLSSDQRRQAEWAQLDRLLRLSGGQGYRVVAATVIALGQGYDNSVTLDVGSSQGIRPEETVLNGAGLVGTVTSVSPWSSTVLLTTDATAVTGVRVVGSGQLGWVTGEGAGPYGPGLLRLRVLGGGTLLAPGQQLVTSASPGDRPFVPGIPVGVISQVQSGPGAITQTALVRPFVDFGALDVVGVVVGPAAGSGAHQHRPRRGA
jgi:rod shape-determining protein MreC